MIKVFNTPNFKGLFTKSYYVAWQPSREASMVDFLPSLDNKHSSSYLAVWAFGRLLLVLPTGVYLKKSERPEALAKLATVYNKVVETMLYESQVQKQVASFVQTPYKLHESDFVLPEETFKHYSSKG